MSAPSVPAVGSRWRLRVVEPEVRIIDTHLGAFGDGPSVEYQRVDKALAKNGRVMPTVRRSLASFLSAFEPVTDEAVRAALAPTNTPAASGGRDGGE